MIGIAHRHDTGRPEFVYGPSRGNLEHELRLTDFHLLYPDCPFERDVKVGKAWADGMLTRDGTECMVEIDNSGKMTRKQWEEKWKRYDGYDGFVLIVCMTEKRMQRLRNWAANRAMRVALFNTFEGIRDGKPWVDAEGKTVAI